MQARRIEEKEGNSLIKDNTTENSTWLTRKQSQAILRARTSMMTVKMNHKNGLETLKCRYCCEADEPQEHIIQECTKIKRDEKPIPVRYTKIFKENNIETNRARARALIEINQKINENQ